ncbi:hypothetical protein [Dyella mobilis]|uniref:Uncharacterized protein n=1 Tax=Dyella mobilis TaxID=1849582 RepID=A0ABS2KD70_9GAMM|nr:hypothetical protein [Dyella mobilis]MBM7129107.1 hypothetical protein [Dyella mobilis]GLQ98401.1 hypothetical protein GCM10007863_28210 [Dyella mobilis]
MPSPWTELLFLHGHIGNVRLARELADPRPQPPHTPCREKSEASPFAHRVAVYVRWCLGIGDGSVRSQ